MEIQIPPTHTQCSVCWGRCRTEILFYCFLSAGQEKESCAVHLAASHALIFIMNCKKAFANLTSI